MTKIPDTPFKVKRFWVQMIHPEHGTFLVPLPDDMTKLLCNITNVKEVKCQTSPTSQLSLFGFAEEE